MCHHPVALKRLVNLVGEAPVRRAVASTNGERDVAATRTGQVAVGRQMPRRPRGTNQPVNLRLAHKGRVAPGDKG